MSDNTLCAEISCGEWRVYAMATETPKTRLKGPQRRELIVAAALPEFAERGYEAASVGRIARSAGVARTVLYDHFPSKHALFVEVLDAEQEEML